MNCNWTKQKWKNRSLDTPDKKKLHTMATITTSLDFLHLANFVSIIWTCKFILVRLHTRTKLSTIPRLVFLSLSRSNAAFELMFARSIPDEACSVVFAEKRLSSEVRVYLMSGRLSPPHLKTSIRK